MPALNIFSMTIKTANVSKFNTSRTWYKNHKKHFREGQIKRDFSIMFPLLLKVKTNPMLTVCAVDDLHTLVYVVPTIVL